MCDPFNACRLSYCEGYSRNAVCSARHPSPSCCFCSAALRCRRSLRGVCLLIAALPAPFPAPVRCSLLTALCCSGRSVQASCAAAMLRTLSAATSALRPALPSAAAAWSAAPIAAAAQPAAAAVFARSFAHAAPRAAAAESSSASSGSAPSSSSAPRTIPGSHRPFKKAPRPELPFPARVPLAVPQGESGMDASGHWHESAPKHPSFKEAIASEVYTNAEVRGSGHIKPKHLNSPVAVFGIGVPSQRQSMPPPLRRTLKPHSVQDVPIPMKTYTKGPREMGHKIVRTFLGHVTSDKMQKTIAVEVSQFYRHPKYHKYIKTSKKFLTHDESQGTQAHTHTSSHEHRQADRRASRSLTHDQRTRL